MLNESVNFDSINGFVNELANRLILLDNSISVIRFGSSLNYLAEGGLDIDILLLSKKSYFNKEMYSNIESLKQNLIDGQNVVGYPMANKKIEEVFANYIQSQSVFENSTIIPKFILGPFIIENVNQGNSHIYLHVKGPITEDEFCFFCKELPFHGYSILANHKVVSGEFDTKLFFRGINLTGEKLKLFNLGLKKRVEKSRSLTEIRKCYKKILLNYNIYNQSSTGLMQQNQIEQIKNIECLKKLFSDIYQKIEREVLL
jgi:hypothetical protein